MLYTRRNERPEPEYGQGAYAGRDREYNRGTDKRTQSSCSAPFILIHILVFYHEMYTKSTLALMLMPLPLLLAALSVGNIYNRRSVGCSFAADPTWAV